MSCQHELEDGQQRRRRYTTRPYLDRWLLRLLPPWPRWSHAASSPAGHRALCWRALRRRDRGAQRAARDAYGRTVGLSTFKPTTLYLKRSPHISPTRKNADYEGRILTTTAQQRRSSRSLPLGNIRHPLRPLRNLPLLHRRAPLPLRRPRRRHNLRQQRLRLLPLRQASRPLQGCQTHTGDFDY